MTYTHIDNTLKKIVKLETKFAAEPCTKRQTRIRKRIDKLYIKIRTSKEAIDNLEGNYYVEKFKFIKPCNVKYN